MPSSTSFVMQIATLCIEIDGYNGEDSACLRDLKRVFAHHEVGPDNKAVHRIVVCASKQFVIPSEAVIQWVSPCLGVADKLPRRRFPFFARLFGREMELPRYSGTCDVICYKDTRRQVMYFMTKNAEWRIEHNAAGHVTYVYSDIQIDMSDGLPAMLINVIGSQYGCYILFASCVAADGEALLFAGRGGVGKTTLCMELIRQGATYIGDDIVLVYQEGSQAMAGSLLFPVKYCNNRINHKNKIDVVSQLQQRPPLNVPLKSVYYLQRSDKAESYRKPMPGGTMFEKMLDLTNKANTNADAQHFVDTISHVCDTVPCYYLFYGDYNKIDISFFRP